MTCSDNFVPRAPSLAPNNSTALDLEDLLSRDPCSEEESGDNREVQKQLNTSKKKSGTMSIAAHLAEFRKRLVLSVAGIAVATVGGWVFSEKIFQILQEPFVESSQSQTNLMSITFSGVASAFDVRLQIGIFIGVVVSCPWWAYQIWAFINPGLSRKERRNAILFICSSVPLFLFGAWIAWTFLPQAIAILTGFAPEHTSVLLSADTYFTFILRMTVAFGLAFLLPVVMVALTTLGVVSSKTWLKQWRVAILLAFIFAAVATPTGDIGTLCALAVPICVVYFGAIAICAGYEKYQILKIEADGKPLHYLRILIMKKFSRKVSRKNRE
ncbi:MAG: twin-arginine translocase subunit TatC [Bifidobacteriaceae bacterium]|jgi:sec-independent protein translocase protein TatC|nr:twin-arginine translocase subunit TatC [Bifidobacteriaceae bacterium]MCI1979486.1 twin-arginine translocase subunit TatC [Bifidobacteriaceae bacterium]